MTMQSACGPALRKLLGTLLMSAAGVGASAHAFLLDTSALAGQQARLEINLLDGDLNFGNNSASAFGSTIFDPDTISQDFLAGGLLNFDLSFTRNFAGGDSDLIVINLLDAGTNFTLVDTDLDALSAPVPYEDALAVCRLDDGSCLLASASTPNVTIQVPEPGTLGLLAFIPGVMAARRLGRRTPHA